MSDARNSAETLALGILAWLAGNEDLLPVFLGASGASEADLHAGLGDPEFLAAVLDFVLMDDAWIIAACDSIGIRPDAVMAARQMLPGGAQVHWT